MSMVDSIKARWRMTPDEVFEHRDLLESLVKRGFDYWQIDFVLCDVLGRVKKNLWEP